MNIAAVTLNFIDGPEKDRVVRISDYGSTLVGRGLDADVRLAAVDQRMTDYESTARRLEAQGDTDGAAAVRQELWTLQRYRTDLRERGAAALYG